GRGPGLYAQPEDVVGGWQNFTVVVFLPADIAISLPIRASAKSTMTDWQEEQTRYGQNWDGGSAYSMRRAGRSQKGCTGRPSSGWLQSMTGCWTPHCGA